MKSIPQEEIQLEIDFHNTENTFLKYLHDGCFFVLYEISAPRKDDDIKIKIGESQKIIAAIEDCESHELPAGIAVTSGCNNTCTPDNLLRFTAEITDANTLAKTLVYISGRDMPLSRISKTVKFASSLGLNNIVPVSGNAVYGENAAQTSGHFFAESVSFLKKIQENNTLPLEAGCVVNPFMYSPGSSFTQYYKLIKKINLGAKFIVTQFGWDMLKYQELQWYLTYRGYFVPSIARLAFLTPELVEDILKGMYPGIRISPDFHSMLKNENNFSRKQFEAAQWRRIQIQAAGCKFLGYNGIQLAGFYSPDQIKIAQKRIYEALREFTSFEDWQDAYAAHIGRSDMSPYPDNFYLFQNLLEMQALPEKIKMNYIDIPSSTTIEKIRYIAASQLLKNCNEKRSDELYLLKKLFAGCKLCKICRLPETHYICPEQCPKHLSNGPCGGAQANGFCEVNDRECIHISRMKLALWKKDIDALEEIFVEQSD